MKKIFKYIFAGMAAMSVVACSEDALETSPSSSVSGNELLGTATNALVSCLLYTSPSPRDTR